MQLKTRIQDFLARAKNLRTANAWDELKKKSDNGKAKTAEMNFSKDQSGLFQSEGMSTGTARFIIERNIGDKIGNIFDIKDLKNTGRYYIAKIVRPDGSVIEQLLVDKQNGTIYFPKGKYR